MPETYHSTDLSKFSFLITGGAGFIGSNIIEYLANNKAGKIRVLDNLSTGFLKNINKYIDFPSVEFIEGDIRDYETCKKCCEGIDFVSHQAALGSVPRSILDPQTTHAVNATGFLNMILAAKEGSVKRFIFASSSAVYGDHPALPKKEDQTGNPLSPYAVSKKTNELYAKVFADTFKMEIIGLRYFNVFGPNQSPSGPYAAVIPLFIKSIIEHKAPFIDGDGEQTRDFTYVENVIQANMLAMLTSNNEAVNKNYNIAIGERVSVNKLFNLIAEFFKSDLKPAYREKRSGDIRDSLADISAAKNILKYRPAIQINEGLKLTMEWFKKS